MDVLDGDDHSGIGSVVAGRLAAARQLQVLLAVAGAGAGLSHKGSSVNREA
jgi:hypothetical protein